MVVATSTKGTSASATLKRSGRMLTEAPIRSPPAEAPEMARRSGAVSPLLRARCSAQAQKSRKVFFLVVNLPSFSYLGGGGGRRWWWLWGLDLHLSGQTRSGLVIDFITPNKTTPNHTQHHATPHAPGAPHLAAAADVRDGEDDAPLQQRQPVRVEGRVDAGAVGPVRSV